MDERFDVGRQVIAGDETWAPKGSLGTILEVDGLGTKDDYTIFCVYVDFGEHGREWCELELIEPVEADV